MFVSKIFVQHQIWLTQQLSTERTNGGCCLSKSSTSSKNHKPGRINSTETPTISQQIQRKQNPFPVSFVRVAGLGFLHSFPSAVDYQVGKVWGISSSVAEHRGNMLSPRCAATMSSSKCKRVSGSSWCIIPQLPPLIGYLTWMKSRADACVTVVCLPLCILLFSPFCKCWTDKYSTIRWHLSQSSVTSR